MSENKIVIKDVTCVYGKKPEKALELLKEGKTNEEIFSGTGMTIAVREMSLNIEANKIFVIMGLSGSGKSTLIKCINRLIEPDQGEILVDNENILRYSKKELQKYRQEKACMVFQEFALLPHRTLIKNVEFGLEASGISPKARKEKALAAISTVGLSGWENAYPQELSGGMKQRVGLARALASDPDILLMDEPFSALDPLIRKKMQQELLLIQKQLSKTIVFITHDINEAFFLGDRIAIIKDGKLQQEGNPMDILMNPQNDYVASFIKDVNVLQVMNVSSIMKTVNNNTVSSKTVSESSSLLHAFRQMDEYEKLSVSDCNGNIIGEISKKDIIGLLEHKAYAEK